MKIMFKRYVYNEGLTSLTGSNGQYLINIMGQIKDKFGNDVQTSLDKEGHLTVNVCGWDGIKEYRVIDLVAIQFKSLKIPVSDYSKIIAFVIDGNKFNIHAENIGYRFLNGKLEVVGHPGFYYVPGITSVGIDIHGKLLYIKTGKIVSWYVTKPCVASNSKGGYYTTNVLYSTNTPAAISRHRALCLVFKEYPDNVDKLTVNHKDGVPGNDELDNLEWATRGQNNLHAYINDLKTQHKRVLVRDVLTGIVDEYYSISECSRVLGYATDETIRQRLYSSKFCQVFEDGKQFKLKEDDREWIIPSDPVKAINNARIATPIKSLNCVSGVVEVHESIAIASLKTGVNNATIAYRLAKKDSSLLFGYQFKLLSDKSPWLTFTEQELIESLKPSNFSVVCKNHFTDEEIKFDSVSQASVYLNNSSLSAILRGGKQPLLSNGWQVKYSKEDWDVYDNVEEEIYRRTSDIAAKNETTGEVIIAESARQMGFLLNLDSKEIRKAAFTRGNKIYHGYRFRLGVSNDPWPETTL